MLNTSFSLLSLNKILRKPFRVITWRSASWFPIVTRGLFYVHITFLFKQSLINFMLLRDLHIFSPFCKPSRSKHSFTCLSGFW